MAQPFIASQNWDPPIGWRLMAMMKVDEDGCWIWQAFRNRDGYGRVSIKGRQTMAHRASYEYFVAPIPAGETIDHRCRKRACINPYHMEVVTLRENILRGNATGAVYARRTHCGNGHPLSGDNLYLAPKGFRVCKTCRREQATVRMRKWRAEKVRNG